MLDSNGSHTKYANFFLMFISFSRLSIYIKVRDSHPVAQELNDQIDSFIQQIFITQLWSAGHCSKHLGYISGQNKQTFLLSWILHASEGE